MNSLRMLLVDDSRTTRLLVQAYLVGLPFTFYEASSGTEGLERAHALQPNIILSDVFMPGVGGWEFVRRLRRDPSPLVRNLPVILASSKRGEEVMAKSLEAGADAFLPKPLAGEDLVRVVRRLLGKALPQ